MAGAKKNRRAVYGLIVILLIIIITIFGDKIKADSINDLINQVVSNEVTQNTIAGFEYYRR